VIEAAKQWVKKGNRSINIEIGKPADNEYFSMWAYDYDLMEGQHVDSIEEINIELLKEKRDRAKYKSLKAKFG
jgi:hypothetical protein